MEAVAGGREGSPCWGREMLFWQKVAASLLSHPVDQNR